MNKEELEMKIARGMMAVCGVLLGCIYNGTCYIMPELTKLSVLPVLPAVWMKEVPKEILNGIYEKWRQGLKDGWNEEQLWNGCDLCVWLDLIQDGCNRCPLREDDWCNNGGEWSKLHIGYGDDGSEDPELSWADRVKEFLVFLKPYCTEDNYE